MKKNNKNFEELLVSLNTEDEVIELIEDILGDIGTHQLSDQEIITRNINRIIEKEVIKRDS